MPILGPDKPSKTQLGIGVRKADTTCKAASRRGGDAIDERIEQVLRERRSFVGFRAAKDWQKLASDAVEQSITLFAGILKKLVENRNRIG